MPARSGHGRRLPGIAAAVVAVGLAGCGSGHGAATTAALPPPPATPPGKLVEVRERLARAGLQPRVLPADVPAIGALQVRGLMIAGYESPAEARRVGRNLLASLRTGPRKTRLNGLVRIVGTHVYALLVPRRPVTRRERATIGEVVRVGEGR